MDYGALALAAHQDGRFDEAADNYVRYLAQRPDSSEGWHGLAMLLHSQGNDPEQTIFCYRRLLDLSPDNIAAHHALGVLLTAADRPAEALPHLERSIAANRTPLGEAYMEMVCCHVRMGRPDLALDAAEAYRAANPNDPIAYYLAAWAALKQNSLNHALYYITDAVSLEPAMPFPMGLRGLILSQMGRVEESRSQLKEMVGILTHQFTTSMKFEHYHALNRRWREVRAEAKRQLGIPDSEPANFVMITGGLGDQYFQTQMLEPFKRANSHYPLVAISGPRAKWQTMYPGAADLFMHLDAQEIISFARINRMSPDYPYTPWFPWIGQMVTVYTLPQIAKFLFGVPQHVQGKLPTIAPKVRKESLDLFRRLGGKKGRSVLVSNLSNSNPMNGDEWWRGLVKELSAAGFVVFQNVANMMKPNPGEILEPAIPVELPIEQVIPFCEEAGHFIGIRSGLCDMLGHSQASMKAIHVKKRYLKKDTYALSVWLDHTSGLGLRRCFENNRWQDIELEPDARFDPALIADWVNMPA